MGKPPKIVKRQLRLPDLSSQSWGPRRVGKSYFLRKNFPSDPYIDLLKTDVFIEYTSRPALLRERSLSAEFRISNNFLIIDEIQKVPAFNEFLRVAALTSSELINYTNISREVGVSAKVVRSYFQILEDTFLGYRVALWVKSQKIRLIETEKFYLFDIVVTNFLSKRSPKFKTPEFGKSFEQLILMEL